MRPILVGLLMFILNIGCSSQPEISSPSPDAKSIPRDCPDGECCSNATRNNILKQSLARKTKDEVEPE